MKTTADFSSLTEAWHSRWEDALALWSSFIRLRDPVFCVDEAGEKQAGLSGSFAQIDLFHHQVTISLRQVRDNGLEEFPLEIMGHEIGHHILCPANLTDHGRMLAIMRHSLPTMEHQVGLIANLYSDLLINDRLFREHGLKMDQMYIKLRHEISDPLWDFYMRCYEILWELPQGTLCQTNQDQDLDARLTYRIIRNSIQDFLKNAGTFASLCLKYLLQQKSQSPGLVLLSDAIHAGPSHVIPDGLTGIGEEESAERDIKVPPGEIPGNASSGEGQFRQPFEYGQILKAMGVDLSDREIAVRYYRERALPYLIPFPEEEKEQVNDPLPEGLESWDIGESFSELNIMESLFRSPVLVPGYTTLQRTWGTEQGGDKHTLPLDLDLYVDCSGSMPDPTVNISYLTLAGCILALSALRAGASVQATLWSGTNEFYTTPGFIRYEKDILQVLTGYFGNGTAFPIHILRDTYGKPRHNPTHILIISDEGVDTLYLQDEQGHDGYKVAETALKNGGGGGSMVLNLYQKWESNPPLVRAHKQGWDIYPIKDWSDLISFSRDFVKKNYMRKKT